MRRLALIATLLFAPSLAAAQGGEALLRQISTAHRGTWWTTLTFVQRTTWPGTPGRAEETWYETMDRPGKLRLDFERNDSMVGGALFRNDSIYQWGVGGAPTGQRPLVHPLLVLLHDIHVGPIDASIEKVRGLRFDLSKSSTAMWEGKSVAVVGALAGDTTSAQFWVDPERLVVVRIIQPIANGGRRDTRIGKFSEGGPGLVEREINFFTNGTHDMKEEYTWIRSGVVLDPAIFMPGNTATPAWVAEYKRSK
jgi:hypothetical protein